MTHVFISYSRGDTKAAEALAKHFQAEGYTVWWDYNIDAGQNFRTTILEALQAAQAVIVIWSKDAIASHWVMEEALLARDTSKLVAVHVPELSKTDIPFGFRQIHADNIEDRSRIQRSLDRLRCHKNSKPLSSSASQPKPAPVARTKFDTDREHFQEFLHLHPQLVACKSRVINGGN